MSGQYASYPSLRDRPVLVTGGASGIGAAMVEHFAGQGARVAFLDLDAEAGAAQAARTGAHFERCDLRDILALRDAMARAAARVGRIAVLVNNAARDDRHRLEDVTPEYWDERMATNLRHQFFAAQAVAPGMIEAGGGSIVNFGSVSWRIGQGGMPAYTTAKAAVEGLTRSLARDLGPHGVRVNTLIPGWIMTERQRALWLTPEADAERARTQCIPDQLVPADVARLVLWLAADDSRLCTNQCWVVDGGRT
jgi:NAD(P)-dependent dehydrogenase (short-subunit alcohol dehydrogenase family)